MKPVSQNVSGTSGPGKWLAVVAVSAFVIQISGAWIWQVDSASTAEIQRAGGVQFKVLVYALTVITSLLALQSALSSKRIAFMLFFVQFLSILASTAMTGSWFYGGQAILLFLGMTLSSIYAIDKLGFHGCIILLSRICLALLLLSAALAIIMPSIGVHHGIFNGQWRGAFNHKNQLGNICGMSAILAWVLTIEKRRVEFIVTMISAWVCVLMSGSALGFVVVAASTALGYALTVARGFNLPRALILAISIAVVILVGISASAIATVVLASLGKDATFSGRTEIWIYAWRLGQDAPIFGHGPGFLARDPALLAALRQVTFAQLRGTHNSYIENFLSFGYLGAALHLSAYWLVMVGWLRGAGQKIAQYLFFGPIAVLLIMIHNVFEADNLVYTGLGTLLINILVIGLAGQSYSSTLQRVPTARRSSQSSW